VDIVKILIQENFGNLLHPDMVSHVLEREKDFFRLFYPKKIRQLS